MNRLALPILALLLAPLWPTACSHETVCPSDERQCDGVCRALAMDPQNCGACGHACSAGETCSAGQCLCANGRADCDGACVDLESDPGHCGSCTTACDATQVCTTAAGGATACADSCAEGSQTSCDRACVDLTSDAWSCGACGRACGTGERCQAGSCAADLYLACYDTGDVRQATRDLAPAGTPLTVAPGPIAFAWSGGELFVASAQPGGAETVARIARDPPAVRASKVWSDAAVPDVEYLAAHGGLLYLAHNSLGTLLVLSPSGAVVEEHAFVGASDPNPNPLGIAFAGDRAYVALQASNELSVLDVSGVGICAAPGSCIHEVARVDLQPLASPGAQAKPARVAVVGGRAYVTLWNLDASFNPPAGSSGRLAVVDLASNALDASANPGGPAGLLDLGPSCLDPADAALQGSTLYVTCGAFDYSQYPTVKILGQGIVPVDVSGPLPSVGSLLPAPVDAAPGELAFCSGSGYVGDRNSGRVFRLDPAAGAIDGVLLCPPSPSGFAYVADIACGF